ncbi:MAG: CHAT domain-containing protein [Candidatus Omnitrophica bacterium]|nr:CHAT domain-containing protein [Candidatus Omnitrophota bacterium]
MSLYAKDKVSPLKTMSVIPVNFSRIEYLNSEIINIINKANQNKLLDVNLTEELKKNTRLLYDLLLTRQVKSQLSSLGTVNLVLSLDERLISIPWEILFDGNDFLCLKFNIGRNIHTRNSEIYTRHSNIPEKPRMLILADPTGDLKSAYQEGLQIKNFLIKKTGINVDFKAQNIDSNYVRKNLRDYDIIHFAGHCEYNSRNPQESGWLFTDGWISIREFIELGHSAPLPSVIFANGCQSACAASDIIDARAQDDVYSLAQAFILAGARHYLGCFWRTEDNVSWEFAKEFYNQVVNSNSIAGAVRSARLAIFHKYGISAITWLGYVLYGNPEFVLFRTKPISKNGPGLNFPFLRLEKKKVFVFASILLAAALSLALTNMSSYLNPGSYFLYSKAERLYHKGDNSQTLKLLGYIIKNDPLYLSVRRLKGDVHFRLGMLPEALVDYFDYARLSESKGDYRHLAAAYNKIGWIYHMRGEYPRSQEFYKKALDLSIKNNDKLNEADALARLAVWHIDKGNNEAAFSLLTKSSEINRRRQHNSEHKFNLACDYFNIAFLYLEKKDYSAAKDFFNRSKQLFENLGAIPELSDYYFDMGEIALFEKKYDLAHKYYQKGLAIDKRLNHKFNLSSDYWMLGEFYLETGKLIEAENYLKQALSICQEIDNRPVLAGVYYDLGLIYKEMNKQEKAKESLSQALYLYKDIDTPDYSKVQQEYLSLE